MDVELYAPDSVQLQAEVHDIGAGELAARNLT
jgi:hypothetical protein